MSSKADPSRRVALLARPGAARDCIHGALLDVGADIVAVEDPATGDEAAIRACSPDVVMVVLDAASEDALGRFDLLLADPAVEVMFEEADVAVAREGWEAARWRRHLSAKLHHRNDVLPPVAGTTAIPAIDDSLSVQLEELIAADAAEGSLDLTVDVPMEVAAGTDFSIFDPVAAEADHGLAGDGSLVLDGLELEGATDAAGTTPFGDLSLDGIDGDGALPPVTGPDFSASDFDPLLAELDAGYPDDANAASDWQGGLVEDFGAQPVLQADDDMEAADAQSGVPIAPPSGGSAFGELSLVDDAPAAVPASPASPFARDLGELERRISSLQLVDDEAAQATTPVPEPPPFDAPPLQAAGDAASTGAVLVMAGLGGPDAVRQLLGALPAGFSRAVLVRQRLDGARHDRLVTQLQRATAMPVVLATPGTEVSPGTVYIVGDDVDLRGGDALRFVAGSGGDLVAALDPARSAVLLLSGSDPGEVDGLAMLASRGLWLGAQAADGCYDPVAPQALAAHGATEAPPSDLAHALAARWAI